MVKNFAINTLPKSPTMVKDLSRRLLASAGEYLFSETSETLSH